MSNFFSSIGSGIQRIFTIPGSGAPSPQAPPPAAPTPIPPAPIPMPNSASVMSAEMQAVQKALGFGRLSTILTSMFDRPNAQGAASRAPGIPFKGPGTVNTIGGGGSSAGGTYGAATLGGSK